MNFILLIITFIFLNLIIEINCHGRLLDPASRTSAWIFDSRFPTYYDDKGMNCGGFSVQWQQNNGKCGICGENYSLEPKQFEKNGSMYKGYIVKTYQQGEIITVNVEITANHLGYFQFMICNLDQMLSDATTDCLNKTYLTEVTSNQTKIYIQSQTGYIYTKLKLPAQLTCNHCVFQWKYNTGNSWGTDQITGQSGLGLGPQEQFYGCSDINIRSNNSNLITILSSTSKSTIKSSLLAGSTTKTTTTIKSLITTNIISSNSNYKCPKGDGYYASKGCIGYYQCIFSGTQITAVILCPAGLLFDVSINICNWASSVVCTA